MVGAGSVCSCVWEEKEAEAPGGVFFAPAAIPCSAPGSLETGGVMGLRRGAAAAAALWLLSPPPPPLLPLENESEEEEEEEEDSLRVAVARRARAWRGRMPRQLPARLEGVAAAAAVAGKGTAARRGRAGEVEEEETTSRRPGGGGGGGGNSEMHSPRPPLQRPC